MMLPLAILSIFVLCIKIDIKNLSIGLVICKRVLIDFNCVFDD